MFSFIGPNKSHGHTLSEDRKNLENLTSGTWGGVGKEDRDTVGDLECHGQERGTCPVGGGSFQEVGEVLDCRK